MKIGDFEITKDMMPSFSLGSDYPLRQYMFMQDTITNALNKQAQLQNPQNGVSTQPVGAVANQQSVWSEK